MTTKINMTSGEISTAIVLLAGLDPDEYKHPSAKALIYKCKGIWQSYEGRRDRNFRLFVTEGD